MIDYLGGVATGQTLTTVAYSLTVLSNDTDVLVSCEIDSAMSEVGWMGFGVGSTMSDADITILWPNSDSSWTLSHRRATTTAMPLLLGDAVDPPQSDSTKLLSIVSSLSSSSSSDSPTIDTFTRPLSPDVDGYTTAENYILKREINQGVIFAKGDENPGNEKQDTDLKQHSLNSMGGSYVDLSAEFKADSEVIDAPLVPVKGESSSLPSGGGGGEGESSSNSSAATSSGTDKGDSAASATSTGGSSKSTDESSGASETGGGGGTATKASDSASSTGSSNSSPSSSAGSLSYSTVITIHAICAASAWQSWITTPLTFGAVGLAYYATTLKASAGSTSGHKTLGFTFAILLLIQVTLGWWTHLSHEPPVPGVVRPRALKAWLHIILGVSLIGIGFVQVRLGMEKYGATDKMYTMGYWGQVTIFLDL
ncbi:hypothetical protein JCM16303_006162 [Sporobolomyces ruberrimus]